MTQADVTDPTPTLDVLTERLEYHLGSNFPPDVDWRDFAARLIRDLKDEGVVLERPYLLTGTPR